MLLYVLWYHHDENSFIRMLIIISANSSQHEGRMSQEMFIMIGRWRLPLNTWLAFFKLSTQHFSHSGPDHEMDWLQHNGKVSMISIILLLLKRPVSEINIRRRKTDWENWKRKQHPLCIVSLFIKIVCDGVNWGVWAHERQMLRSAIPPYMATLSLVSRQSWAIFIQLSSQ